MRMSSAISFGVFCLLAPSTSPIIRSRKVSPGLEVIWTTIRSDSTTVPPVTAERSPPDSRTTGADSPVMADSSTSATPSMTSPSPGMTWFAVTTQRSPTVSAVDGTVSVVPRSVSRQATVSLRLRRSVSAWALPLPSATASAKLANSTVAHSQAATSPTNTLGRPMKSTVVITEPTSTRNITGMRIITRGSSLTNAWPTARRASAGSNTVAAGRVLRALGGRGGRPRML
jgi:hypothetical protein